MNRSFVWPLGLSCLILVLALVGFALVSPGAAVSMSEDALSAPPGARPGHQVAVSLAATCPDNYEPNDYFSDAAKLDVNTAYSAAICVASDVDYYMFYVGAGWHIRASIYSLPTDFDLDLYDPGQNWLVSSTKSGTTEDTVNWDAATTGWYYMFVHGKKGECSEDPYSFKMEVWPIPTNTPTSTPTRTRTPTPTPTRTATRTPTPTCPDPYEPNDSFEGAWPIAPGDLSSYICERSDQDYFSFSVALHDTVEVWLLELPGNYDLFLFGPTHSDEGRSEKPGTADEYIRMEDAKFAGDYRVLVSTKNDYSPTSPYKLRLRITRAPTATPTHTPTPPNCKNDPYEPNDTFDKAAYIGTGETKQGLICPPGDVDFFVFGANTNITIDLQLRSLPADYDLYLWSPEGQIVAHSWNSGTTPEAIQYRSPAYGLYRAEVRPVYGQWHDSDTYELTLVLRLPTITPTMTRTRTPTGTPTRTPSPTPTPTTNPRLDLTVAELEINQAIQTHSAPFFAPVWHKPTVARVYIRTGLEWPETQCVRQVTARIRVRRASDGPVIRTLLPYNPGGEICAGLYYEDSWMYLDASLNFDIPADLLEGVLFLQAEVNYDRRVQETNYDNNLGPIQMVQFRPIAKRLSIAWFPIHYAPDDYSGATDPTSRIADRTGFLKATWPIRPDYVTYWRAPFGPLTWTEYMDWGFDYWWLLHNLHHLWSAMDPQPDHLVAWLPGDAEQTTEDAVGYAYIGDLDDPEHCAWVLDYDEGDGTLSHELEHNYGFEHSCYNIGGRGFDVLARKVRGPLNQNVMCTGISYTRRWADVISYRMKYDEWWAPLPSGAASTQARAPIPPTPYVEVSGVVTPSLGTAMLWPLELMTRTESLALTTAGDYCLDFLNSSAALLAHHCFTPRSLETGGQGPELKGFFLTLPWPAGTTRVLLKQGTTALAERSASARQPTVQVVSPNGGETWGDTATVRWSAQDSDGDPLTYSVLYTWDGGESWTPLAVDLVTTTLTVSTTYLPGGEQSRVKVRVTDGFYSAEAMSAAPFTVPRKPPQAVIESPAEGARYRPTDLIPLMGQGYDPEDGNLPGDRLEWWLWTQTGSTYLGSGTFLSVGPFPEGKHTIVINAVDSDNDVGVASRTIYVGERGKYNVFLPAVFR